MKLLYKTRAVKMLLLSGILVLLNMYLAFGTCPNGTLGKVNIHKIDSNYESRSFLCNIFSKIYLF